MNETLKKAAASRAYLRWQASSDEQLAIVVAQMSKEGLPPHFHDMWSIGMIVEGDCSFRTLPGDDEQWHLAPPGSLFLLRPYETHACGAGLTARGVVLYALLYVDAQAMCELAPGLAALCSGTTRRVWPAGMDWVRRLLALCSVGECREWIAALQDKILADVDQQHQGACTLDLHGLQYWLHTHWQDDDALQQGKQAEPHSDGYVIRTFRERTGLTPSAYLRQYRLHKSRRWLETGRQPLPLAELAAMLGFADQAHFTRAFKQVYGVTPGQWRQVAGHLPE